jgi:hypothetical protein
VGGNFATVGRGSNKMEGLWEKLQKKLQEEKKWRERVPRPKSTLVNSIGEMHEKSSKKVTQVTFGDDMRRRDAWRSKLTF